MSAPARVLLFDVDGTLVHAGGAGRRAVERALAIHVGGLDRSLSGLRLDGMTDRLIVREVLRALGRPFDDALCDRVLGDYVGFLREEIHGPGYRVLPGVAALLGTLARRGASMGLCTGNVEEGARLFRVNSSSCASRSSSHHPGIASSRAETVVGDRTNARTPPPAPSDR